MSIVFHAIALRGNSVNGSIGHLDRRNDHIDENIGRREASNVNALQRNGGEFENIGRKKGNNGRKEENIGRRETSNTNISKNIGRE